MNYDAVLNAECLSWTFIIVASVVTMAIGAVIVGVETGDNELAVIVGGIVAVLTVLLCLWFNHRVRDTVIRDKGMYELLQQAMELDRQQIELKHKVSEWYTSKMRSEECL